MSKRKILLLINLLVSGVIAFAISMFYAQGTIGENYTDEVYVAPEFFIVLVIWGIGALFACFQFYKDKLLFFVSSLVITWLSIPLGIFLGFAIK
ncbi:hypothetical protein [Ornithinibacillus scapharcae]|uniref:hypothetical protein n=1 Tax=Ornithinibacillus scapharcae TaxID=1147159 RepID=UPI000225B030|nr:hypothetical protein [Ornithinibacillus scapharcae]